MSALESSLDEVEKAVWELPRDEPVAALATLNGDGYPATDFRHYTTDGLRVYTHTFTFTRNYGTVLRDRRVGLSMCSRSPGGFDERRESQSIQLKGHARAVTEAWEIAHAVSVMRARSAEPAPDSLLNNTKPPADGCQQVLLRVDPVEAPWADHRVRLLWRRVLDFSDDGTRLTGTCPCDTVIGRKKAQS